MKILFFNIYIQVVLLIIPGVYGSGKCGDNIKYSCDSEILNHFSYKVFNKKVDLRSFIGERFIKFLNHSEITYRNVIVEEDHIGRNSYLMTYIDHFLKDEVYFNFYFNPYCEIKIRDINRNPSEEDVLRLSVCLIQKIEFYYYGLTFFIDEKDVSIKGRKYYEKKICNCTLSDYCN